MIRFKESVDPPTLFILDSTGQNTSYIRQQLVKYKKRWGTSLANNLAIIHVIEEAIAGSTIIVPQYILNTLPSSKPIAKYETVPSINAMTHYDLRAATLEVKFKYTKDIIEARSWLNSLPKVFSYDCETAKADGLEDIPKVKLALDPRRNQITMYSFATSETEGFVISNENQAMEDMVLGFLTTTESKVIMHNASFDMGIIRHRTGLFIKNFEDTQIMWRVIDNHVEPNKALVSLKHLGKRVYKNWAVSKDEFNNVIVYTNEVVAYNSLGSRII